MKYTRLLFCLTMGVLWFSQTDQVQAQLLNKLKKKAEDKLKQEKNQVQREAEQEIKEGVDQQLEGMRNSYDSTSFSLAIALSDNSGLFEYDDRAKKLQKFAVNFSDAFGITKDQSTDRLQRAKTASELGQMSYANNRFKRAEFLYQYAKGEFEDKNGTNTLHYPVVVADLGLLYHTVGRYSEAEEYSFQALELRKSMFGENHNSYAVSLNNIAMLQRSQGKYNEAEKSINESLRITESTLGKNSVAYAIILNNKAMLFQTIGRYQQAETLLKEATDLAKASMRENSNNYQKLLVNLALLYQEQKKYSEAEAIYTKAIQLKEGRLGTRNHPDLAHMLNLLASLYVEMGKNDQVEELLQEAIRIYDKNFGTNHPAYATTASNLGNFYRVNGKTNEAQTLLREALEIRKNTLGEKHPDYNKAEEDLALVYWQQGNYLEAAKLFREVLARNNEFIRAYFPPMSEAEKEKYWDKLRPTYLRFYSFATDFKDKDPSLLKDLYEAHLATKAILLQATNRIREEILASNDQKLIDDYNRWVDAKENLAHLYTYSKEEIKEQKINLDSTERATNALEKSVSQRVPQLFENPVSYQDIVSRLGTNEAAVEIITFHHFDKQFTDEVYYGALVAKQGSAYPEITLMTNGNELEEKYFKYYRNVIKARRPDKYSYDQYWSKIAPLVANQAKLYVALDGVYNQVSLNTLQKPDGKYILDEKSLIFLTSTKDLLQASTKNTSSKQVTLIGFPNYGNQGKISPLPGTKAEVESIEQILKTAGYQPRKYMQGQATEGNVKEVSSPRILHIATHGFFMEDAVNTGDNKLFGIEIDKARENPLLRSGLMLANSEQVLSGANAQEALKNRPTVGTEQEDNGILTAYEAMNMSLGQTELVILSACETGLGDVKAGEGVYGLQRAFQVAGTDALIMSLWTVSDAATQELMTLFYKYWLNSGDKIQAFKKAQLELKNKFAEPYYWGAFLLVGK